MIEKGELATSVEEKKSKLNSSIWTMLETTNYFTDCFQFGMLARRLCVYSAGLKVDAN